MRPAEDFERACREFTHQVEIAANWEANDCGASLRTRLTLTIAYLRAACDRMEKIIAEDRK